MIMSYPKSRGHTLVELVMSLAVVALLMGSLASAMVLASRALPADASAEAAPVAAYHAAEELAGELYCAQSFSLLTSSGIEFTVADRNNDSLPETIRYEWSGTPGDPLTRRYNGGAPLTVAHNVHQLAFAHAKRQKTAETTQIVRNVGPEAIVAFFDGWSGVTATTQEKPVDLTNWVSQYFTLVTPSPDTKEIVFTRAYARMRRGLTIPLLGLTADMRRSQGGGSFLPASSALVTSAVVSAGSLPTTANWIKFTFPGTAVTDLSRSDYCLVLKGGEITPVYAENFYANSAPNNNMVFHWSSTAGVSWSPASKDINKQDLRFMLYGSWVTESSTPVVTTWEYLTGVRIYLQVGDRPDLRVDLDVPILNEPEVTGL